MTSLLRRIKRILLRPPWLSLLSKQSIIYLHILLNLLKSTTNQNFRILLNHLSGESLSTNQFLSKNRSLTLSSLLNSKQFILRLGRDKNTVLWNVLDNLLIRARSLHIRMVWCPIHIYKIKLRRWSNLMFNGGLQPSMKMKTTIFMFLLSNDILIQLKDPT